MRIVDVHASREYRVLIGRGLLSQAPGRIREISKTNTVVLVTGEHVFPLYGERLQRELSRAGFRVLTWVHPSGESEKNLKNYERLLNFLCGNRIGRSDLLLALGGGVTGDLCGFAAATYQRGMDYVQIPTTLLAMVDASVGGKTALDLPGGKNQVGCFWQPRLVLCDTELLSTLPEKEFRSGSAEVAKCAVILGEPFFRDLASAPLDAQLEEAIERCVTLKRDLVEEDEFDRGARRLLNLGHSIGHAVEVCRGYAVSHGEAVSVGMAMIARAAPARGLCSGETKEALIALLRRFGLPVETELRAEDLAAAMLADKKRDGDRIHLVFPEEIGRCGIYAVALEELTTLLRQGGAK